MQAGVATVGAPQQTSRVGWSLLLLAAASACVLSVPASRLAVADACSTPGCHSLAGVQSAVDLVLAAVWLAAAAFILLLGTPSRAGITIGLTAVVQALSLTVGQALPQLGWPAAGRALGALAICLGLVAVATFPDGRFVPRWTVAPLGVFVAWEAVTVAFPPANGTVADVVGGLVFFVAAGSGVFAQVYRYRQVTDPVQRRQTKWLVYGLGVWLGVSLAVALPYFAPGWFPGLVEPGSSYDRFQTIVSTLAVAVIPVCVTLAIVREQLFDIDVVIGRTVVYAVLSLIVGFGYLVVVAGVGSLLGAGADAVLPLVAAAMVAVVFQPLRAALQRRVRRSIYGLRDEPYAALSELGRRLAATLPGDDVEARVVASVREALRVPYAAIALRQDDGYRVTQQAGTPTGSRLTLPLVHQGEEVGLLIVDDEPGSRLTEPARALLADLARQAGVAVHGVRLTASLRAAAEQLEAARARLVVAAEDERARIRRNLHDDLAPTLAAAGLTASAAADLLDRDPQAAARALGRLQHSLRAGLGDIRRLVDELRPVMLDERGLVGAIRERADALQPQLDVVVDAPAGLPDLPAAVEVAAYRICQEALMNVLRHSGARSCRVRVAVHDEVLAVDVADDGVGMPAAAGTSGGVGLLSMRERALELGGECTVRAPAAGGTEVSVRLPLAPARD